MGEGVGVRVGEGVGVGDTHTHTYTHTRKEMLAEQHERECWQNSMRERRTGSGVDARTLRTDVLTGSGIDARTPNSLLAEQHETEKQSMLLRSQRETGEASSGAGDGAPL